MSSVNKRVQAQLLVAQQENENLRTENAALARENASLGRQLKLAYLEGVDQGRALATIGRAC